MLFCIFCFPAQLNFKSFGFRFALKAGVMGCDIVVPPPPPPHAVITTDNINTSFSWGYFKAIKDNSIIAIKELLLRQDRTN